MTNFYTNIRKLLALILVVAVTFTFTPVFALEAFASESEELTLTLVDETQTTYLEDKEILIKASGSAEGAWVGLYKKGDVKNPDAGGVTSFRWYSVADYDGAVVDITKNSFAQGNSRGAINAGEYEIVLFGDSGYDNIKKTINITIVEDPNKEPSYPSDELTLKLVDETKTTYKVGEQIYIMATGTAPGAWVGLYEAGAQKNPMYGGVTSYRWYNTIDYNGEKMDITNADFDFNNRGALEEGDYELILFGDGGYDNIVKTIPFSIKGVIDIDASQFVLETDKTDYAYGEDIKVKAEGTGINNGAWVGLYYSGMAEYDETYMYFYYVREYEGTFTTIQKKAPGPAAESVVPQGTYDLVLFADSGYTRPIKKLSITVTRTAMVTKIIREAGCTTMGVEFVVYEDETSEYREIPTLGGHDWSTPVKVSGKSEHKYTCKRDACHQEKVEACTFNQGKVVKAATVSAAGKREYTCSVCGGKKTVTIPKLKAAPKLSASKLVYNGKNRKPSIQKLYDKQGNVIPKKFYTVSYPSSSKNVGTYKVTVKFKGDYAGTYKLTYKINPKAVTLKKLTKGKQSVKVTWKKAAAQTTGYQIAYSTNKNFKNASYKKIKKVKTTSTTIKKLKSKKTYYVKVRTYKVKNGKTYYSAWSKTKYVKTK